MIVNRWGRYRALEDFADVEKGEVIDVTGVVCGTQEIMWFHNHRVHDWYHWDIPVESATSDLRPPTSEERPPTADSRPQKRELRPKKGTMHQVAWPLTDEVQKEYLTSLISEARAGSQTALAIVKAVSSLSVVAGRKSEVVLHETCVTCSHSAGWDSAGVGYCSEPLGIAELFDVIAKFPVTDEQYCSNHSPKKTDLRPPKEAVGNRQSAREEKPTSDLRPPTSNQVLRDVRGTHGSTPLGIFEEMERNPVEVIDAILEQVPKTCTALRADLERDRSNAFFVAPELMQRIWMQLGQTLAEHMNSVPQYDWELQVASIVQGKPISELEF